MSKPADLVRWRDRILRRRVLIPAAGVLVAALGVGALVLIQGPESPSATTTTEPSTDHSAAKPVPVEIGTAIVQERGDDGSLGDATVRTDAGTEAPVGVAVLEAQTLER